MSDDIKIDDDAALEYHNITERLWSASEELPTWCDPNFFVEVGEHHALEILSAAKELVALLNREKKKQSLLSDVMTFRTTRTPSPSRDAHLN